MFSSCLLKDVSNLKHNPETRCLRWMALGQAAQPENSNDGKVSFFPTDLPCFLKFKKTCSILFPQIMMFLFFFIYIYMHIYIIIYIHIYNIIYISVFSCNYCVPSFSKKSGPRNWITDPRLLWSWCPHFWCWKIVRKIRD